MGHLTTNFRTDFTAVYNDTKEAITIRVVTRTRDDSDGVSEAYADTVTSGIIITATKNYQDSDYGLLPMGDAVCYVEYDETVNRADYVVANSLTYEITDIIDFSVEGNLIYRKLLLSKLD